MLKKIALLLLLIAPMSVFAQKFGHIKSADVLTVMPEFTKAQTDIQAMFITFAALSRCSVNRSSSVLGRILPEGWL